MILFINIFQITLTALGEHKEFNLATTLSFVDLNRIHYEEVQYPCIKRNNVTVPSLQAEFIPIAHYNTFAIETVNRTNNQVLNSEDKIKIENDGTVSEVTVTWMLEKKPESTEQNTFDDSMSHDNDVDSDGDDRECSVKDEEIKTSNKFERKVKADNTDTPYLVEEYATLYPLSMSEAKAVVEVEKKFAITLGKHQCKICLKTFVGANRLKMHTRIHEKVLQTLAIRAFK